MIHDPPTLCQPYFDSSREPGDRYRFQRMCGACWNAGAQLWYSAAEAAEAAATAAAAASAAAISAELYAIPDAVVDAAVRQAEGGEAAAASDDDALPPDDSYLAAASGDEAEDAEPLPPPPPLPPPSDQPQPAPLVVPPPPLPLTDEQRSAAPVASPSHLSTASPQPEPEYMSTDDERGLAKRIWTDCSDLVPRPRYDGTLSSAAGAALGGPDAAAALTKLRKEMPALPHIKPAPAEQRARALYVHAGAGSWTPELKKQARSCFEAEAAAVECVLCIPEVVCREELMETPQFQVKEGDAVVGCKVCCPQCKVNDFVLPLPVNVNRKDRIRFAYGNNRALNPVACDYKCVNPDCAAAQAACKGEELQAPDPSEHDSTIWVG